MSVSADEFTESLHILTRNARAWTALCEALHIQPDTHPAELAKKFESLERWRSAGQTSLVALEGAFDSEADKGPQPGPNSPERLTFLADTAARTKNELITLRRKTTDPCGTCRKEMPSCGTR